ncbi:MAG: FAD-binding oxidoreductase [Bacteroidota bacterium]
MDGLPASYLPARITRREDHTDDLATFWLRPERPVAFRPGQYVTLALPGEIDGRLVKRPYSVLSAPHETAIELFVERVEGGELTPRLFDRGPGDTIGIRGRAAGAFALDTACTHHAMACTVTGVAPFLSMLRDAASGESPSGDTASSESASGARGHRFLVLYGASTPADLGPYADELAAFTRGEHVTAVATVSRPWAAPEWTGESGRVEDVLRKHLDALGWPLAETAGYACGNPVMVENVQGVLKRAGLDAAHLHEEAYLPDAGESAPASAPPASAPPAAAPARRQGPPVGPPGGIVLKTAPRPRET